MVGVIGVGVVEELVEFLDFVLVVITQSIDLVMLSCAEFSTLFVDCVEIVGGVEGDVCVE